MQEVVEVEGYEIEEHIEAKGMRMTEVYRARHLETNLIVVVKVLMETWANNEATVESLHREAEALADLNHSNLLKVYDIGQEANTGRPYFAMQFVEGGTVADRLENGPLPPSKALRMLREATEGLQEAYEAGVRHLVTRPASLLLNDGGRVLLGDFGVTHADEIEVILAESGKVHRQSYYLAPEQWSGEASLQSYLWGLGVSFYEMLTAEVPFGGDTTGEVLKTINRSERVPVHEKNPSVPASYEALIENLLARESEDRFASFDELLDQILELEGPRGEVEEEGVEARETTAPGEEKAPPSPVIEEPDVSLEGNGEGQENGEGKTEAAEEEPAEAAAPEESKDEDAQGVAAWMETIGGRSVAIGAGAGLLALMLLGGVYFAFFAGAPSGTTGAGGTGGPSGDAVSAGTSGAGGSGSSSGAGGSGGADQFPLVTAANPDTAGDVSKEPARERIPAGQAVQLEAQPRDGWEFSGWSDGVSSPDRTYEMGSETTTLTAQFERAPPEVALQVGVQPEGAGSVVREPSRTTYPPGTQVELQARSNDGWVFAGWSDGVSNSVRNYTVPRQDERIVAQFQEERPEFYTLRVRSRPVDGGKIARSPDGQQFEEGTTVRLSALPNDGWVFEGWSDGSSARNRSVTLQGDRSLSAEFRRQRHTLSVVARPSQGGRVTRSPDQQQFEHGSTVQLNARPGNGWEFEGWSDGSSARQRSVTLRDDVSLVARFRERRLPRVDGFEQGSFRDRWSVTNLEMNASVEVSTARARDGQRSLHIHVGPTGSGEFSMQNIFGNRELRDGDAFTTWVYADQTPVNLQYRLASSGGGSAAMIHFARGGNVLYGTETSGSDNVILRNYQDEQWYRVTMVMHPDRGEVEFQVQPAGGSARTRTSASGMEYEGIGVTALDYPGEYDVYLDDVTYAPPGS